MRVTPIVEVVMLRDWGGVKAGDIGQFDKVRADYLIEHGYAAPLAENAAAPEPEPEPFLEA